MLVYFCTVARICNAGGEGGGGGGRLKVEKQTKTKLTVNSNDFYHHIVDCSLFFNHAAALL